MPVGLNSALTKQTVDSTIGNAASALNIAFIDVEAAQVFLAGYQTADLESLGYTADEVATLKSAIADLDRLRLVYEGLETVAEAYDFRTFARRVYGTGFVEGR